MDTVTVNMGYVVNGGTTLKQGRHVPEDDQFAIKVEVQLSDHKQTAHNATFDIYFAAKLQDTIVIGWVYLRHFLHFYHLVMAVFVNFQCHKK